MPAIRICIAVSLALCFAAGPARAQFWGNNWGNGWRGGWGSPHHRVRPLPHAAHKPPAQTSGSPEEAIQDQPAPYDRDLQRLSEILGALHFLRGVCNNGEGEKWRSEAKALIDAEAPGGNRREQMVASFNRSLSLRVRSGRSIPSKYRNEFARPRGSIFDPGHFHRPNALVKEGS
jgi:uncharacterized protein (TIGR02301 family)